MAYAGMPQFTGYAYGRLMEVMSLIEMIQMTEAYSVDCAILVSAANNSSTHKCGSGISF